jgi:hypothetical protein
LIDRRTAAVCCTLLLAGCATSEVFRPTYPNALGTCFRDREEVLAQIPVGTPDRQARAVMLLHGYEPWVSRRHEDDETVRFYPWHLSRVPDPERDPSVTLHFQRGALIDVEFHPGPADPPCSVSRPPAAAGR